MKISVLSHTRFCIFFFSLLSILLVLKNPIIVPHDDLEQLSGSSGKIE